MLTTKLTGEIIPDFDAKIVDFLNSHDFNDPDDHAMIIGIDNYKGKLYRVIEVTGTDDYLYVTDFLESIHMMDVLTLGIRIRTKGCHNRFRAGEVTNTTQEAAK